jgi:rRNA-processing protein FCF1
MKKLLEVASSTLSIASPRRRIVVDTNFLLMPYEYGVDLPTELIRIVHAPITLVISSGTERELDTLAGRNGRRATAARFILQNMPLLKSKFPVEVVPSSGEVDEWIIKFARNNAVTVATNDVRLRKRLLGMGVPVIVMKGKSKLDFV